MARQNVGNPKFYIDLPSYWMAKGSVARMTDPKLLGLNPSDFYKKSHLISQFEYASWDIEINQEYRVPTALNYPDAKYFFGIFGHNFVNCKGYKATIKVLNSESEVGSFQTWDEICNFPIHGSSHMSSGWSLGQRDDFYAYDFDTIRFRIGGNWSSVTDTMVMIGSFAFGYAFQMPHSPDLKLTMTREYDGIQEQNTRGGSTLTQINYSTPPHWIGVPAWELINFPNSWADNPANKKTYPSRGRRVWDLKFSYVAGDDLFSVNEMYSYFNPTDSDTNSEAGYNSTDFDGDGHFVIKLNAEWSFINIVMNHTIGGALPFVFQPDGNNNSPDQFAICKLDQGSFKFKQVAHNVYDISLKIREVW